MGLDMRLYEFSKPDANEFEGKTFSYKDSQDIRTKYRVLRNGKDTQLSKSITENACKCTLTDRYLNVTKILQDTLIKFGFPENKASYAMHQFYNSGSFGCRAYDMNTFSYTDRFADDKDERIADLHKLYPDIESETDLVNAMTNDITEFFKSFYPEDKKEPNWYESDKLLNDETATKITLYQSSDYSITVFVAKDNAFRIVLIDSDDLTTNLTCPYIDEKQDTYYVTETSELCYQREGLNEYGYSSLPRNCEYCDDKNIVTDLVENGNLSHEFIDEWVDGKTVFFPWW